MVTRREHLEPELPPGVVAIVSGDDSDLVDLDEWLDLVAADEPVDLPNPASDYLHEARETGEV